jgi:hypothetical protein
MKFREWRAGLDGARCPIGAGPMKPGALRYKIDPERQRLWR